MSGRILDHGDAYRAILSAKRAVTLVSAETRARYTYRVCPAKPLAHAGGGAPDREPLRFVYLLTGPDNTNDYTYIGVLAPRPDGSVVFKTTSKSKLPADAPPCRAISWAVCVLPASGASADKLEVWHDGTCCRCAHPLTVPESLERGLGPECARRVLGGG